MTTEQIAAWIDDHHQRAQDIAEGVVEDSAASIARDDLACITENGFKSAMSSLQRARVERLCEVLERKIGRDSEITRRIDRLFEDMLRR